MRGKNNASRRKAESTRWYHVLIEMANERRYLIAIEAASALEARRVIARDWGEGNIRSVT